MRDSKTIEGLFGITARLVRTIPYYRSAFLVASSSHGRSVASIVAARGMVMLQLRSKETLDRGDYGWLKARHHFVVSARGNLANGRLVFFFQAEDGIRDSSVTGVQTCALPISVRPPRNATPAAC